MCWHSFHPNSIIFFMMIALTASLYSQLFCTSAYDKCSLDFYLVASCATCVSAHTVIAMSLPPIKTLTSKTEAILISLLLSFSWDYVWWKPCKNWEMGSRTFCLDITYKSGTEVCFFPCTGEFILGKEEGKKKSDASFSLVCLWFKGCSDRGGHNKGIFCAFQLQERKETYLSLPISSPPFPLLPSNII